MSVTGKRIVSEARLWLGTPFHHQGRARGAGVDCIGLVAGIAQGLRIRSFQADANGNALLLSAFDRLDYAREPQGDLLRNAFSTLLRPIRPERMRAGDVALFTMARHPQHVAIIGDYAHGGFSLIHAYEPAGMVCEHRLDDKWLRRLAGLYRFRRR